MKANIPTTKSVNFRDHWSNFNESFVIEKNLLTDKKGLFYYKPHQIEIKDYFKLNRSKPLQKGMVYLIETYDGRKGVLLYQFDAFTDSNVYNFLKEYVDYKDRNDRKFSTVSRK